MTCDQCHKGIPLNQGYYQHVWAGRLINTCYVCKPPPYSIEQCGHKDPYYRPCVSPYGHPGDCAR